jgi:hypothetical protein
VGGAPRIAGKMKEFDAANPLVLFSGDALNPSLLSRSTQGSHMIEVLNALGVACSVIGNHDLDFGVDNMVCVLSLQWHARENRMYAQASNVCILRRNKWACLTSRGCVQIAGTRRQASRWLGPSRLVLFRCVEHTNDTLFVSCFQLLTRAGLLSTKATMSAC